MVHRDFKNTTGLLLGRPPTGRVDPDERLFGSLAEVLARTGGVVASIDFQFRPSIFLDLARFVLQSQPICPPPSLSIGPVQLAIDHFEFGPGEIRHNVPESFAIYDKVDNTSTAVEGFQTQLAQQVIVYLTTVNDVMLHPNDAPAIILAFPFSILFDIDFYPRHGNQGEPDPDAGDCYLNFTLKSVTPLLQPFIPPNFDPKNIPFPVAVKDLLIKLTDLVGAQFPRPALSLKKIVGLIPHADTELLNVGVSVDTQNQLIDFRVEIGESTIVNAWSNFFNGFVDDRLQGAEWALFGEKDYLTQTLWLLVSDAIDAYQPDNPSLFVNCTYSNAVASIATFTVTVEGVYDLPASIQVDGKVSIPIELSIPVEDLLQGDIYIPDLKELAQSFAAPWTSHL